MRACTAASAIFFGIVICAATFSACASSGTPPQTSDTSNGTAEQSSVPTTSSATADTTSATASSTGAAASPKKQPESAADCKELKTTITNEPPAGAVAMNNAAAPGDAGASDRLDPIVETIRSNRDKFRCCFDLWGRKNAGGAGRVWLALNLKPDGSIITAETLEKDSTVTAPEVHSCMVDVAKSISWPKSPSGKETKYRHPFDFKAHH